MFQCRNPRCTRELRRDSQFALRWDDYHLNDHRADNEHNDYVKHFEYHIDHHSLSHNPRSNVLTRAWQYSSFSSLSHHLQHLNWFEHSLHDGWVHTQLQFNAVHRPSISG